MYGQSLPLVYPASSSIISHVHTYLPTSLHTPQRLAALTSKLKEMPGWPSSSSSSSSYKFSQQYGRGRAMYPRAAGTYKHTYIHTYIHSCLPTYLPTYQTIYLPTGEEGNERIEKDKSSSSSSKQEKAPALPAPPSSSLSSSSSSLRLLPSLGWGERKKNHHHHHQFRLPKPKRGLGIVRIHVGRKVARQICM